MMVIIVDMTWLTRRPSLRSVICSCDANDSPHRSHTIESVLSQAVGEPDSAERTGVIGG